MIDPNKEHIGLFIYKDGRRERREVIPTVEFWQTMEFPPMPLRIDWGDTPTFSPAIRRTFRRVRVVYPSDWQGPHESEVRFRADNQTAVFCWQEIGSETR